MLIIGLMSGTSVDGIDAALVDIFEEAGRVEYHLLKHDCYLWEPALREAILSACRSDSPLQFITALNYRLGVEFAEAANQLCRDVNFPISSIDAIASHGQTIWHQPDLFEIAGAGVTGTMQIGEPAVIAARTGCLVVADFRAADMAVGGCGAPLVPFADFKLFSSSSETRAIQNLGGIANVTLLPRDSGLDSVIAFDTGPGNMPIDFLIHIVSEGRLNYDVSGEMAASGSVDRSLLNQFLEHPYFTKPPPKTTGREDFGEPFARRFLFAADARKLSGPDMLATATALTAESIGQAYRDFVLPTYAVDTVILGGGGVHNKTLVDMLRKQLSPARITTHSEFGLPDDAKEALAFAIMAYETLHNRSSNVPSATGARSSAILGKIVYPPPGKIRMSDEG